MYTGSWLKVIFFITMHCGQNGLKAKVVLGMPHFLLVLNSPMDLAVAVGGSGRTDEAQWSLDLASLFRPESDRQLRHI